MSVPSAEASSRASSVPHHFIKKLPVRVTTADVVHCHALATLATLVGVLALRRCFTSLRGRFSVLKAVGLAMAFHLVFRRMVESPTTVQLLGRLVRNWTQGLCSLLPASAKSRVE